MAVKILDINESQHVVYAVPLWVRDEQIKLAIARVKDRIQPVAPEARADKACAVVCFGPSLNDTYEAARGFQFLITCSGAHKFLRDQGFDPARLKAAGGQWFHLEVDPRPHKADLLGDPHPDVEYLIASTCHPAVFDRLDGYAVKLWHVFANEEESKRVLPPGEWALTGGSSAGLRAMTMARFFGFTDLHIFGMDGCEGPSGKHAAAHPLQPAGHSVVVYDGVEYRTTPSMLECAKQTFHELDVLPDVTPHFYGEGLTQAMARKWVRKPIGFRPDLAYIKDVLISPEYAALNARLHRENVAYGVGGGRYAETVCRLADSLGTASVLDYGCGKGYLAKAMAERGRPIWEYDPCVPGKTESPRPADLVVCTDVLEHIEPDRLGAVLADLARCVRKVGYFVIYLGPSTKTLADGRNSHLIQQEAGWWAATLRKFFFIPPEGIMQRGPTLHVVVGPK